MDRKRKALAAPARWLRARHRPMDSAAEADLAWTEMWRGGGVYITQPLAGLQNDQGGLSLGMLVQPDGDVTIFVPEGFGAGGRRDEAAVRALMRRARRELHAALAVPAAGWGGFVCAVLDLTATSSALALAAFEAVRLVQDQDGGWRLGAALALLALRAAWPWIRRLAVRMAAITLSSATAAAFRRLLFPSG